jgi:hypothetical protein
LIEFGNKNGHGSCRREEGYSTCAGHDGTPARTRGGCGLTRTGFLVPRIVCHRRNTKPGSMNNENKLMDQAPIPQYSLSEANFFGRLLDPFRMLLRAKEATLKGYQNVPIPFPHSPFRYLLFQFPVSFFRLSTLNYPSGLIVVDRSHLKELFDAPSSKLAFFEAALEDIDFRYTFTGNSYNLYHVPVIRNQLTRGIQAFLPDICEEVGGAFNDDIGSLVTENGRESWERVCNGRMDSYSDL